VASRPERARTAAVGVAATLASATALWHATGLAPFWWLAWFATWPVLAFALQAGARAAAIAAFVAWVGGGLNLWHYYRETLGVPLPIVLLATALPAIAFSGCTLLARALVARGRPLLATLALPAAWTSFEHALARLSPHGTFGSLAYTQLDFLPIVQLAAVCGTAGIAFLLLLVPSALAVVTLPAAAAARRRITLVAATLALVALGYGTWRLQDDEPGRTSLRVGLVAADRPEQPLPASGEQASELLARYRTAVATLTAAGADVIVLPETVFQASTADAHAQVVRLAGPRGERAPVVVVGVDRQGPAEENAAFVANPDGTLAQYAKRHLLLPPEARYHPGEGLALVPVRSVLAGVAICKDLDFPQLGRDYARRGAALLLVPAWDFGVDGRLHSRMAVLRGVEGGFAVARAARSGRLTLSDDRGRLQADSGSATAPVSSVLAAVSVGRPGTVHSALGDWFSWLCCALLVAAVVRAALDPHASEAER
jgi:apolipoprotein N-acyltransferase